jgi:hypothetical protein
LKTLLNVVSNLKNVLLFLLVIKKGSPLNDSLFSIIENYVKHQSNHKIELKVILTHCDLSDKVTEPQNENSPLLTRIHDLDYEWADDPRKINEK